jgi:hypothetical protein
MNITLSLYLLSIVDGFLGAWVILGVLGFFGGALLTLIKTIEAKDYPVTLEPLRKLAIKLFFACLVIITLVPDQKGLLMIFGGTEAYRVLQSPEAREIGGKSLQLLNKKLDEALADSKPEKGESK